MEYARASSSLQVAKVTLSITCRRSLECLRVLREYSPKKRVFRLVLSFHPWRSRQGLDPRIGTGFRLIHPLYKPSTGFSGLLIRNWGVI